MNRRYKGFTLIELMITLVIAAVLTAVAIPNYQQYVQRARRVEARAALENGMSAVQKFYIQNGRYPVDGVELNLAPGTENGYYVLSYAPNGGNPLLTATASAGKSQAHDTSCQTFSLSVSGLRKALDESGVSSADCW